MKNLIYIMCFIPLLTACGGNHVDFTGIKVIDDKFNTALETTDSNRIKTLKRLFNDRVEDNQLTPEFKYLIELQTDEGSERWKYSIDGYMQIHKQGNQPIYAIIEKNKFNQLAKID